MKKRKKRVHTLHYEKVPIKEFEQLKKEVLAITPPEAFSKKNFFVPEFAEQILATPTLNQFLRSFRLIRRINALVYNVTPPLTLPYPFMLTPAWQITALISLLWVEKIPI